MNRMLVIAAALLAGCMPLSPQQVMESGVRETRRLAQAVEPAARCVATNAEEIAGGFQTNYRPIEPGRAYQVTLGTAEGGIMIVARVESAPTGSTLTVWRSQQPLWTATNQAELLAKGC